jgi:hypothetical protein
VNCQGSHSARSREVCVVVAHPCLEDMPMCLDNLDEGHAHGMEDHYQQRVEAILRSCWR